jgi:transcriptional regulator with XRE-family HTH domain
MLVPADDSITRRRLNAAILCNDPPIRFLIKEFFSVPFAHDAHGDRTGPKAAHLNLYHLFKQVMTMKDSETKARFIEMRGQGLPLAKISTEINVSKPTLISWERNFKEEIDNVRAIELEAMYDKYYLSARKKVEFFGDVLKRIKDELETRDLSTVHTDKLFAMYAHFYREAQNTLPKIEFRDEDEIQASKSRRLLLDEVQKSGF